MNGETLEEVESLKLGATLYKDGTCTGEIRIRLATATAAMARLNKIMLETRQPVWWAPKKHSYSQETEAGLDRSSHPTWQPCTTTLFWWQTTEKKPVRQCEGMDCTTHDKPHNSSERNGKGSLLTYPSCLPNNQTGQGNNEWNTWCCIDAWMKCNALYLL